PTVAIQGYNGYIFDDGDARPDHTQHPADWQANLHEMAGRDYSADLSVLYANTRAYLQSLMPNGKTCVNSGYFSVAKPGDCFALENAGQVKDGGACNNAGICPYTFDEVLPGPNNPNNTRKMLMIWDTYGDSFLHAGVWVPWDRGNRG